MAGAPDRGAGNARARGRSLKRRAPTPREGPTLARDLALAAAAVVLAAIVCQVVLHERDGDADEWGYTYQAAVFAKWRAYASVPHCQHYLESMYVFELSGRLFSQYTPGWPMFIVPFVWMGAIWLSGPFSLGLMTWGMARLGRSAARGFGPDGVPPSARAIRAAGTWTAVLATLGTSILTNAGVALLPRLHARPLRVVPRGPRAGDVARPARSRQRATADRVGVVLGVASVQMVAVRPADGAVMGLGLAVVFVWALARRRVAWQSLAAASGAFAVCSAIVLVILRLQLGKWFTTGYSLNALLRTWNVVKFSVPKAHEWKYGLPLATGAYCWWPVSVPLGLAGLARLRGSAARLGIAMLVGCVAYIPFCMFLDVGQRGVDWGYGPRYLMILVVPMAVGCGLSLAPLATSRRRARGRAWVGPGAALAVALVSLVTVWVRIVPPEWTTVEQHTMRHGALLRAIENADLHHAIVVAADNTTSFADLDLTTNLPIDLYPEQPVIIATDRKEPQAALQCLRAAYSDRVFYRASGRDDVKIVPMPVPLTRGHLRAAYLSRRALYLPVRS